MKDCLFCKIISGTEPSYKIYEDDLIYVFLDKFPSNKGHLLLIPKEHSRDFLELDSKYYSRLLEIAKRLAEAFFKLNNDSPLKCEGFNLYMGNGESAGQIIFHTHLHLIPRYKGDKVTITAQKQELSDAEFREIATLLRDNF